MKQFFRSPPEMFIVNNAFRTPNISNVPYKSKFDTPPPSKCIAMCNNRNVWVHILCFRFDQNDYTFSLFSPSTLRMPIKVISENVKHGQIGTIGPKFTMYHFPVLSYAHTFKSCSIRNALEVLLGTYISLVFKIP